MRDCGFLAHLYEYLFIILRTQNNVNQSAIYRDYWIMVKIFEKYKYAPYKFHLSLVVRLHHL